MASPQSRAQCFPEASQHFRCEQRLSAAVCDLCEFFERASSCAQTASFCVQPVHAWLRMHGWVGKRAFSEQQFLCSRANHIWHQVLSHSLLANSARVAAQLKLASLQCTWQRTRLIWFVKETSNRSTGKLDASLHRKYVGRTGLHNGGVGLPRVQFDRTSATSIFLRPARSGDPVHTERETLNEVSV